MLLQIDILTILLIVPFLLHLKKLQKRFKIIFTQKSTE